jgi:hypothetical protein
MSGERSWGGLEAADGSRDVGRAQDTDGGRRKATRQGPPRRIPAQDHGAVGVGRLCIRTGAILHAVVSALDSANRRAAQRELSVL